MTKIEYECMTCGCTFITYKKRLSLQCEDCDTRDKASVWMNDRNTLSDEQARACAQEENSGIEQDVIDECEAAIWGPDGIAARIREARAMRHYRPNGTLIPPAPLETRALHYEESKRVDLTEEILLARDRGRGVGLPQVPE